MLLYLFHCLEYAGSYSKDASTEVIQKPRLNKREVKHNKEDLEKEQKILSNLLEEDEMDDDEIKLATDEIVPVKINRKCIYLYFRRLY